MLTVRACRPRRARKLRLVDLVTPTTNRKIKIRNPNKIQNLYPQRNPKIRMRKNQIHAQCDVRKKICDRQQQEQKIHTLFWIRSMAAL